ncbi:hypothetical protein ACFYUV_04085 [Nonomuraea sp. NPDC003560]|uniref:hypothetical protein n=1 Tax=Nonomuraea sp. NPDC003560 TaxID=3364341 RepID=UPI0036B92FA1
MRTNLGQTPVQPAEHAAIESLNWLIEYWPDLLEARLPLATRRPWQTPTLSPEAQEQRDAEARLDRYFRNPLALGESAAPLDVAVLQTALDLIVQADDLAASLAEAAMCPALPSPGLSVTDARPWLAYARARLLDLGEEWQDWAAPHIHRMYEQAAKQLSMLYTGQTIKVLCPWCRGATSAAPAGGTYTWQIVEMPGKPPQIAIRCAGICEPPQKEVGTWWGGQPCWPIWDWDRLARRARDLQVDELSTGVR